MRREGLHPFRDLCTLEELYQMPTPLRQIGGSQRGWIKAPFAGSVACYVIEAGKPTAPDDLHISYLTVTLEHESKHHRTGPRLVEDRAWE